MECVIAFRKARPLPHLFALVPAEAVVEVGGLTERLSVEAHPMGAQEATLILELAKLSQRMQFFVGNAVTVVVFTVLTALERVRTDETIVVIAIAVVFGEAVGVGVGIRWRNTELC